MSESSYARSVGARHTWESARAGNDLRPVLAKLSQTTSTQAGADMFGGAVGVVFDAFCLLRKSGWHASSPDASLHEFLRMTETQMLTELMQGGNGGDRRRFGAQVAALCMVVRAGHKALPAVLPTMATSTPPEPIAVRVVSMPPVPGPASRAEAGPVEVRVVSMPERKTTTATTIERDSTTGAIIASTSTQLERDTAS